MNFDKIFFQLLIIKTLYQYGLGVGEKVLIAPIREINALNDNPVLEFTPAKLTQYEGEDRFCITDLEENLYVLYFDGDFSSNSIEFCYLHDLEMHFIYKRSDDQLVWFRSIFSENTFIQAFFQKISSYQDKGESVSIFRIARYFNATRQIQPYLKYANLYSKDITTFSNRHIRKTYFITHIIDEFGTIEADFIFLAKNFAISKIYKVNKIALCIARIPGQRILISFSNQRDMQRFLIAFMHEDLQLDKLSCEFPEHLTTEQIFENLDEDVKFE